MKRLFLSFIIITTPLFLNAQCEIVINEILFNPTDNAGSTDANSMHQNGSTATAEWIELYNPSACKSVDISCWILGSNEESFGDKNYGIVVFPSGTVIPPHGFLIVGGAKAPKADFNAQTSSSYCGGDRWYLKNQNGWVALYDRDGVVKNAVYWSMFNKDALTSSSEFSNALSANTNTNCKCSGTTLNSTPAKSIGNIEFAGVFLTNNGFKRVPDGSSVWESEVEKDATPKAYNSIAPTPLAAKITGLNADCGGTGSATVVATGGVAPYSYLWSNGETTTTVKGLKGGSYTCAVSDACHCITNATVIISAKNPVVASVDVTPAHCSKPDGTATANVSGNPSTYKFEWNTAPAQTTQTATNLAAGVYTVKVTDIAGCDETVPVTINNNTPPLTSDSLSTKAICTAKNGMAGILPTSGQSPYTYLWSTNQTASTINNLLPGIYTVVFTDVAGCTGTRQITVDKIINTLTVTGIVKDETCGNANGEIATTTTGGTLPYSYLWSNNATTQNLLNIAAGSYSITVTDTNGCVGTNTSTVDNITTLKIKSTIVDDHCEQGKGSISVIPTTGQAPYTYLWNTLDTTSTLKNLYTGIYSIVVKDALGCQTLLTKFEVKNVDDIFTGNIVGENKIQQDKAAVLSANIPTDWNLLYWIGIKGDTIKKNTIDLYFAYPIHGDYNVKLFVKSIFGCLDSVKFNFTVITTPTFYVPNCITLNGDGINEYFFPKFTYVSELQGWVFNRWGEKIYTFNGLYDQWNGTYKGEKVKEDLYVYRFIYKDLQNVKYEKVGTLLILNTPEALQK
ncbi:MAG: gliding motility-associated C-terminal domain-containing protein [Bacteroidia bacterium]